MNNQAQDSPGDTNYMEGTVVRDTMRDILDRELSHSAEIIGQWVKEGEITHLFLVGCGGSYATMVPLKWMLDSHSTLPVDIYTGWEFVNRAPARLTEHSIVVLASHSGTTEEVLVALELAQEHHAHTLAFSTHNAPLANRSEAALTYDSPAANLSKLLMSYLVGIALLEQRKEYVDLAAIKSALNTLPDEMHKIIQATREHGKKLAQRYRDIDQVYVIGTGVLAGLAYQFTICNLLEMHWIDAAAINAAEFRHGPLEIVKDGLPMIFLKGRGQERAVVERAQHFAERQGADTIVFDLEDWPAIHDWFAPFGLHLPLQWFNWYLGIARDHPISIRRYMGKVEY